MAPRLIQRNLDEMVADKGRKRGRHSERKSFMNFISAFSAFFSCADSSSKVHLMRASVSPAASNTKAEAERTHTKRMDIVKKEKIHKGAENTQSREAERETQKTAEP